MLASILFVLEIVAFAAVAWWAYAHSRAGAERPDDGLLAMRSAEKRGPQATRPRWNGSASKESDRPRGGEQEARPSRSEPRWKKF